MEAVKENYILVSGGVIWRLLDRAGFKTKRFRFRIAIAIALVSLCWLPLVLSSVYHLGFTQFNKLFIHDIATNVRFLIVLPIFLLARQTLNKSFHKMIGVFYETNIVNYDNEKEFQKTLDWLTRTSNSPIAEFLMLVLIYVTFYVQETTRIFSSGSYAPWLLDGDRVTFAGWYYLLISLPVLQLIAYRWIYTIILWIIFLYKISKLNLHLSALHPDGMGGLGFITYLQISYFPVAFAFACVGAGTLNNIIIFSGESVMENKILIISMLVFVILLFILPPLVLLPLLSSVKKKYFFQYSLHAWPFTREYEEDLKEYYQTGEKMPDSSTHIDMIGSFEKTANMSIILIDKSILFTFLIAVVIPFLLVIIQEIPLKEILLPFIKQVFG